MTHWSDDELVLHYYGELPDADEHVATCATCATRASELAGILGAISGDVPERDDRYGAEVWSRVQPHLASRTLPWRPAASGGAALRSAASRWPLAVAATVALLATGFLVGRISMPASTTSPAVRADADAGDPALTRRVLLLSVADHLDRSERVLTDIMNTPADLMAEQEWAHDLVAANRLYRQDALDADESSVATVLDELERALLDIVHRPAGELTTDLDDIRQRIDSAALLFKVRVMRDELRRQQFGANETPSDRSPIPVS